MLATTTSQQTLDDINLSHNYTGHLRESRNQMAEAVAFTPGNSRIVIETTRNAKGVTVRATGNEEAIHDIFYRMGGSGNAEGLIRDAGTLRWNYAGMDLSNERLFPSNSPGRERGLPPRPGRKKRKGKATPGLSAPRVRTKKVRMDAEPEAQPETEQKDPEMRDPLEILRRQLRNEAKDPVQLDGRSNEEFRGDQKNIDQFNLGNSDVFRRLRRDHLKRAA